jgi:hypothetical protein
MKPVGFIPAGDFIIRNVFWPHLAPSLLYRTHTMQVLTIRFLKKTSFMIRFARRAMVFDSEKAMFGCATFSIGKQVFTFAFGACAPAPLGRPFRKQIGRAMTAVSGINSVVCFRQISAGRANENIFWMA